MKLEVPITHRVFSIKGYILSGWLFIGPFWIKIKNDFRPHYETVKLPDKIIKLVYMWLIFLEKIKKFRRN